MARHRNTTLCSEACQKEQQKENKKQFKESEGGDKTMCDLVENYAKKKAAEAAIAKEKDSALRLFKNGASYELVRASIVSLSDEELQTIYKEATEN